MAYIGKAVAYGAVTIINAISCGLGAALGVNLKTEATVKLTDDYGHIEGQILSDPEESTILIKKTVTRILKHFSLEEKHGAYVETKSNIPIARGLKSSSVAANAVALATLAALKRKVDDLTVVNFGVDAALDAGVTITGAFDDACASFFGGIVITDNHRRKILRQFQPKKEYNILIFAPSRKTYTAASNVEKMRRIADEIRALHRIALQGDYWSAMTLNGRAYSKVLGYDIKAASQALRAGAVASGLSGTGPATAAVVSTPKIKDVRKAWRRLAGEVIETRINTKKAHAA